MTTRILFCDFAMRALGEAVYEGGWEPGKWGTVTNSDTVNGKIYAYGLVDRVWVEAGGPFAGLGAMVRLYAPRTVTPTDAVLGTYVDFAPRRLEISVPRLLEPTPSVAVTRWAKAGLSRTPVPATASGEPQ